MLELKAQGVSVKEIGKKFGLSYEQAHGFFKRHNRRQRKIDTDIALRKKGRPPKSDKITRADKVNELKYIIARKDAKIKALEMENELMRDFLSLIERKESHSKLV